MAANRFTIPQFDIDLLNWSNNVNARNDARARQRQQDWNTVYSQAAALGNTIRAENEAEKARKNAAEQAGLQRQFQAKEAEKARAFQAAENLANRQAQEANANAMLNKSKLDNMGKAQAEMAVVDAELKNELGAGGLTEQDIQNKTALANARKNAIAARYGLDKVENTPIPFKPGYVQEQTTVEPSQTNEPASEEGKTAAQEKYDLEQTKKGFETRKEQIRQMKNSEAKAAAMQQLNEDSKGLVPGFTADEIKKAGFQIPQMSKGATVPSDKVEHYKQWYKVAYDPTKDAYVILGRK